MIEHIFAPNNGKLPPTSALLQYIIAGNGIYLHAKRMGLQANIQIAKCEIRGLPELNASIQLAKRAPITFLHEMLRRSRLACNSEPKEILFHLLLESDRWLLVEPQQEATSISVRPLPDAKSTKVALIEIHSHHEMRATFSTIDDEDERSGFRIYGVLGNIFTRPRISLRVGIHGYFAPVSINEVFDL
jgi:PRTRC genetic system protein A